MDIVQRYLDRDGRIATMPAKASKRRLLLEHVVAGFELGVRYSEIETNAVLRAFYDDYVALRRYLVDAGLLTRQDGIYWRTGGYVDVSER